MDQAPPMPLSVAPFEKAGLHIKLDEFESLVMEAVRRALPRRPLVDARADLTADEAAFLRDAGVSLEDFAPPDLGARSPLVQTAADYAALLATALSVPELARRLGVDQSRGPPADRPPHADRGQGWRRLATAAVPAR